MFYTVIIHKNTLKEKYQQQNILIYEAFSNFAGLMRLPL